MIFSVADDIIEMSQSVVAFYLLYAFKRDCEISLVCSVTVMLEKLGEIRIISVNIMYRADYVVKMKAFRQLFKIISDMPLKSKLYADAYVDNAGIFRFQAAQLRNIPRDIKVEIHIRMYIVIVMVGKTDMGHSE